MGGENYTRIHAIDILRTLTQGIIDTTKTPVASVQAPVIQPVSAPAMEPVAAPVGTTNQLTTAPVITTISQTPVTQPTAQELVDAILPTIANNTNRHGAQDIINALNAKLPDGAKLTDAQEKQIKFEVAWADAMRKWAQIPADIRTLAGTPNKDLSEVGIATVNALEADIAALQSFIAGKSASIPGTIYILAEATAKKGSKVTRYDVSTGKVENGIIQNITGTNWNIINPTTSEFLGTVTAQTLQPVGTVPPVPVFNAANIPDNEKYVPERAVDVTFDRLFKKSVTVKGVITKSDNNNIVVTIPDGDYKGTRNVLKKQLEFTADDWKPRESMRELFQKAAEVVEMAVQTKSFDADIKAYQEGKLSEQALRAIFAWEILNVTSPLNDIYMSERLASFSRSRESDCRPGERNIFNHRAGNRDGRGAKEYSNNYRDGGAGASDN